MDSCVSALKNQDSPMKIGFSINSKAQNLLISSPTSEKPINVENPNADFDSQSMKSSSLLDFNAANRNNGTKEEAFFDSQAWLESDCEDDFLSVIGDNTPSRGNTPNYQRSSSGTHRLNEAIFTDILPHSKPKSSPTNKKMRLSDLFKESLQDERVTDDNQNAVNGNLGGNKTHLEVCPKSSDKTPSVSRANSMCSSERTPNVDAKQEREKTIKATQCCLPNFVRNLSFSERKKSLIPGHHQENNTI